MPEFAAEAFKRGEVDTLRLFDREQNVPVTCYVWNPQAYADFVAIQTVQAAYRVFALHLPSSARLVRGFGGRKLISQREVLKVANSEDGRESAGFICTTPALAAGSWYMHPARQDSFFGSKILFDREERLKKVFERVWSTAVEYLAREIKSGIMLRRYAKKV